MRFIPDTLIIIDAVERKGLAAASEGRQRVPPAITDTMQTLELDLEVDPLDRSRHRARVGGGTSDCFDRPAADGGPVLRLTSDRTTPRLPLGHAAVRRILLARGRKRLRHRSGEGQHAAAGRDGMFEYDKQIVDKLLEENDEFRSLFEKHQELNKQVDDADVGVLPLDDLTLHRLKKEKLQLRDRLASIIEMHRQDPA